MLRQIDEGLQAQFRIILELSDADVACRTQKPTQFARRVIVVNHQRVVLERGVRNVRCRCTTNGATIILLLSQYFYISNSDAVPLGRFVSRPTGLTVRTVTP